MPFHGNTGRRLDRDVRRVCSFLPLYESCRGRAVGRPTPPAQVRKCPVRHTVPASGYDGSSVPYPLRLGSRGFPDSVFRPCLGFRRFPSATALRSTESAAAPAALSAGFRLLPVSHSSPSPPRFLPFQLPGTAQRPSSVPAKTHARASSRLLRAAEPVRSPPPRSDRPAPTATTSTIRGRRHVECEGDRF